jgi:hypothetical protein
MLWCCVTPERRDKTRRIMEALAEGWGEPAQVIEGSPPDDGEPFVIWGHRWLAETVIPQAEASGRPYWFIDNGFWNPGGNDGRGYYRFTYRGLSPVLLTDCEWRPVPLLAPWRRNGRHILIAMPGVHHGLAHGLDLTHWRANIEHKVRKHTRRPVIARRKGSGKTLAEDLYDCWALVTHSSNAAVDAVIAGVPVFVDGASAAAPVGNLDVSQIEQPVMPDRTRWLHSLACQHFTLDEMRDGAAWRCLWKVREQVECSALVSYK